MDTPNPQNNTSRMRESRKLEQKRKRQQQVRRQKIFLACSCLILTAGIGLFVTLHHNHQRAAAQEAELRKQIKQKQEAELQKQQELENTTMFLTRESPVLPILSDTGKPVTRKLLFSVSMIPQKVPVKSLPSVVRMLLFPFSTTQLQ